MSHYIRRLGTKGAHPVVNTSREVPKNRSIEVPKNRVNVAIGGLQPRVHNVQNENDLENMDKPE